MQNQLDTQIKLVGPIKVPSKWEIFNIYTSKLPKASRNCVGVELKLKIKQLRQPIIQLFMVCMYIRYTPKQPNNSFASQPPITYQTSFHLQLKNIK